MYKHALRRIRTVALPLAALVLITGAGTSFAQSGARSTAPAASASSRAAPGGTFQRSIGHGRVATFSNFLTRSTGAVESFDYAITAEGLPGRAAIWSGHGVISGRTLVLTDAATGRAIRLGVGSASGLLTPCEVAGAVIGYFACLPADAISDEAGPVCAVGGAQVSKTICTSGNPTQDEYDTTNNVKCNDSNHSCTVSGLAHQNCGGCTQTYVHQLCYYSYKGDVEKFIGCYGHSGNVNADTTYSYTDTNAPAGFRHVQVQNGFNRKSDFYPGPCFFNPNCYT